MQEPTPALFPLVRPNSEPPMVTIKPDGTVILRDGATLDDASHAIWAAVGGRLAERVSLYEQEIVGLRRQNRAYEAEIDQLKATVETARQQLAELGIALV